MNPSEILARLAQGAPGMLADNDHEPILEGTRLEAALLDLRGMRERYKLFPFREGDLITPRVEGSYRGHGNPHVVLERIGEGDPRQHVPGKGCLYDLRVGYVCSSCGGGKSHYHTALVESWEFEEWNDPAVGS